MRRDLRGRIVIIGRVAVVVVVDRAMGGVEEQLEEGVGVG
jgi:hypothetical protein